MTGGYPLSRSLYPAFGTRRILEHFESHLLLLDASGRILQVQPAPLPSLAPGSSLPHLLPSPALRDRLLQALAEGKALLLTTALPAGREKRPVDLRVFQGPKGAGRRWVLLSPPKGGSQVRLSGVDGLGLLLMHEVNNVLTTLAGFAEYQISAGSARGEVKDALEEALALSRRSAGILEFLRNMLRRKDLEEPPSREDPNRPLQDVLEATGWLLGRKHRLESEFRADPSPLPLRSNLLRMALLNLLLNAGKALGSFPGTLRAETVEEEGWVIYKVLDSGPGVPKDLEDRIFEPGVSGGTGLGLGLALVKDVVLLHGGSVEAHPLPEGGLEVTLRIPRPSA